MSLCCVCLQLDQLFTYFTLCISVVTVNDDASDEVYFLTLGLQLILVGLFLGVCIVLTVRYVRFAPITEAGSNGHNAQISMETLGSAGDQPQIDVHFKSIRNVILHCG